MIQHFAYCLAVGMKNCNCAEELKKDPRYVDGFDDGVDAASSMPL